MGDSNAKFFYDVVGIRCGNSIRILERFGFMKRFVLLASIVVAPCINAGPAFAQPVEYVRICSVPGAGFSYIPGTDKCAYDKNMPYVYSTAFGSISPHPGVEARAYATNPFAKGTGGSAMGDHVFGGGDPFRGSRGASNGIDGKTQNSASSNSNTTAVGQGARAGAT